MIAAALSFVLLSGLWPHHHADPKPAKPAPARVRGKVDTWRYEIKTDNFAGRKVCALSGRDRKSKVEVAYFNGVVAFHLRHHPDTDNAAYRVDDGEVRASLNPSAGNVGWVLVPAQSVVGAHKILIRPETNAKPVLIRLDRLDEALAATRAQGCAPDTFPQPELAD